MHKAEPVSRASNIYVSKIYGLVKMISDPDARLGSPVMGYVPMIIVALIHLREWSTSNETHDSGSRLWLYMFASLKHSQVTDQRGYQDPRVGRLLGSFCVLAVLRELLGQLHLRTSE